MGERRRSADGAGRSPAPRSDAEGSPAARSDAGIDDRWRRSLELLLLLFPPLVGAGIAGVLREADAPILSTVLVGFTTFGYAVISIGVPICVFADARQIRRARGGNVRWRPNPRLYALAAILWAPVVGLIYLYRRHERIPVPAAGDDWWTVIAVALAAYLLGILLTVVGAALGIPRVVQTGIGLAGTIAYGIFPAAIYRDAGYARPRSGSWRPNPAFYLGLAFLSLFVAILQPAVAGYYLWRRHRELGIP